MKTRIVIATLLAAVTSVSWIAGHQYDAMAPCDAPLVGGHTGAPGETDCSACHVGVPNTGPGTMSFDLGGTTQYVPGQTYTGTVKISQAGVNKFGFVSLALANTGNVNTGVFSLTDTIRTRTFADNVTRDYVGHTPCGADAIYPDSTEWSFNWTAPPTNVGDITLYIAALATNHNHATSGDNTYTGTIALTPAPASVDELPATLSNLEIGPNPVTDVLAISYNNLSGEKTLIELLDISGKQVAVLFEGDEPKGKTSKSFAMQEMERGVYLIRIRCGPQALARKFIVL